MSNTPFMPHQMRRRYQWLVTYFFVRAWPKLEAAAKSYWGEGNWRAVRGYGHFLLGILALYGVAFFLIGLGFFLDRLVHLFRP